MLGSILIFNYDLLLFTVRLGTLLSLAFLVSCECPADIETPRENTPNSFSEIDVYNDTDLNLMLSSNNVEIEIQSPGNDGPSSYFAGNSIIKIEEGTREISRIFSMIENVNYQLLVYEKDNTLRALLDNQALVSLRIYNLGNTEIMIEGSGISDRIQVEESFSLANYRLPLILYNSFSQIVINENDISGSVINNFIIRDDLSFTFFESKI